ncbi:hypothetical protein N9L13_04035 [Flavobacteriales bacterium]|nr:hypothetical protein [Flavobacteriales bacterium]
MDILPRALIRERPSGQISQRNPREKWVQLVELRAQMLSTFQNKGARNENDLQAFHQILFNHIRTLAKYDLKKASRCYARIIKPTRFAPKHNKSAGREYVLILTIFGFYLTEKLNQWKEHLVLRIYRR